MMSQAQEKSVGLAEKVTSMTVLSIALALFISTTAFVSFQIFSLDREIERHHKVIAEVVANNLSAAVVFQDYTTVGENIDALKFTPAVVQASVSTLEEGDIDFTKTFSKGDEEEGNSFFSEQKNISVPIKVSDEIVGELEIVISLASFRADFLRICFLGVASALFIALAAYFFVRRMALKTVRPLSILQLAMDDFRADGGQTDLIDVKGFDEIRQLSQSFNQMSGEVKARDEQLRRLVLQIGEARDQAEQASMAKTQFLANMSHELRTPLNAIINYSEMVEEDLESMELAGPLEDMHKIRNAGKHLLRLINEILDLSKIEAGKMDLDIHEFNVRTIVTETINTIKPIADRNRNSITLEFDATIAEALSDSYKIRQCLMNLVANACKFTEDGEIKLIVAPVTNSLGDCIQFSVCDSGIGMSEEQVSKLYDAFVQADASTTRRYGGTGLGLTITRRLVELLNGDITIESELGKGSTFTITLPRYFEGRPVELTELQSDACLESDKPLEDMPNTVLIVDDDPDVLSLMERILPRMGYNVVAASSVVEGLEVVSRVTLTAVILDIHFDELDGYYFLEELRKNSDYDDLPVIVASADDSIRKSIDAGAQAHLVKPISKDHFSSVLLSLGAGVKPRILVVEDNPDTMEMTTRIAAANGLDTTAAYSAQEAIHELEKSIFDAIVLDLGLPDVDGVSLLEDIRCRDELQNLPVFILTGRDLHKSELGYLQNLATSVSIKGAKNLRSLLSEIHSVVTKNSNSNSDRAVGQK